MAKSKKQSSHLVTMAQVTANVVLTKIAFCCKVISALKIIMNNSTNSSWVPNRLGLLSIFKIAASLVAKCFKCSKRLYIQIIRKWTIAICSYRWRLLKEQQWLRYPIPINEKNIKHMLNDLRYLMNNYLG